jgi:NAD(P)-dependent dehydrogenase (short-subunit alcohol dehydrogenase family)
VPQNKEIVMAEQGVAIIVGVGPGLGSALARRCSRGGLKTAVAARNVDRLRTLADEIGGRAYRCDAASESEVEQLFARVADDLGEPTLVVFNSGAFLPRSVIDTRLEEFESCWRNLCLGGFLVGREAARRMTARGSGTILLTGATASLRGSAGFVNLAVGKFGLRALAQSMARELGPRGVHVAHVIVDGQMDDARRASLKAERGPDSLLDPDAIAETYWQLHLQQRSAWTLELDLRPWTEKF